MKKEKIIILEPEKYMALNLKNDVVFMAFFARKRNEEFLIDFLEAILKIKIKTIKINNLANMSISEQQ